MAHTDTVEFDLVANAKDSLVHGVRHLAGAEGERSPGDLKRSVRDVVHALELLLKERLAREHPSLVLEQLDKSSRKTVGAERAVQRLQDHAKVVLDPEELRTIDDARSLRNDIEHYRFEISLDEARLNVERLLAFVFRFARDQLGEDLTAHMHACGLRMELQRLRRFWQDHAQRANQHLVARGRRILSCPSCGFDTVDDEDGKC